MSDDDDYINDEDFDEQDEQDELLENDNIERARDMITELNKGYN